MNSEYVGNEYRWIESRFGKQGVDWTRELQSLRVKDGKFFDVIRIRSLRDGKTYDLTFDITGPFVGNMNELRAAAAGHLGGVADQFPAVSANDSASRLLQDCELFFQKGIKDAAAGQYDEQGLGTDWTAHQLELYRVAYRLGRYGEMQNWPEAKKQAWASEAGRSIAYGMDDALAGRPRSASYQPLDSQWNVDDATALDSGYYAAYTEAADLVGGRFNWKLAAGIGTALLAGFGGMYLWQKRQAGAQLSEAYANPAKTRAIRLFGGEMEERPVAFEHGLLFVAKIQSPPRPGFKTPFNTHYTVHETVTGEAKRLVGFQKLADAKEFVLEFGNSPILAEALNETKTGDYGPALRQLGEMVGIWKKQHLGAKANPVLSEDQRSDLEDEFNRLEMETVAFAEMYERKYGPDWFEMLSEDESEEVDAVYAKMFSILEALGWPEVVDKHCMLNPSQPKGMQVQSLLFDKEMWTIPEAKDWARDHGKRFGKVDVRGQNIRLRQKDPGEFKKGTWATIPFGSGTGIQAVVARPKR